MRDCLLMFITCLFLMLSSAGIWRLAIGRAYIFRVQVDPEWENGVQKAMMLVQSDFGDDAANTLLRQDVLQASEDMGLDLGELMEAHPDKAPLGPRASLAQAASTQFSLELGQWEGRLDVLGAVGGLNSGRVLFATFAIAGMWTAREMANGVLQMLPSSITDGVRRFELSVLFNAQGLPEAHRGIWEAGPLQPRASLTAFARTAVALVAAALAFLSMLFFGVGLYGNLQFNFYDPQWAKVDAGGFFNVSYIVESFLLPISFFMHIACYIQRQNGK
ncbi:hypothetical protein AK812_SmicGene17546 [Symbiodinium microadriaticum]|uniref:Uncharacterized protein n=1 Tax=Symbiodinium microadriaticum TaxID=2951 RepID=A0A1Q9DXI0_SYMMI|nr:hypothetical protein AK812_SmicGene17546 [Symbiodinium microadriaticum]